MTTYLTTKICNGKHANFQSLRWLATYVVTDKAIQALKKNLMTYIGCHYRDNCYKDKYVTCLQTTYNDTPPSMSRKTD